MTFADIVPGSSVFLDANTFVYHFIAEPTYGASCTSLLERVERSEIVGWVSPHVLAEVSHRLMTLEACTQFGWPYQGIASRLRSHPQELAKLQRFRQSLLEISQIGVTVVTVSELHVVQAAAISIAHGLLTNDALVVALMLEHNLTNLASNDADFDRVAGITRFAPV